MNRQKNSTELSPQTDTDFTVQGDPGELSEEEIPSSSPDDGIVTVRKNGKCLCCMTVIGQIEGHYILPAQNKTTKYEHMIPQLVSVEEDDGIDGLLLILNTVGGDIEAGLAIAELVAGMHKPTVSLVLGGGHSIGIPLAVSAKKCFIAETATMTLHPVRINGTVLGVEQSLQYLQNMQERIVSFVSSHSRITDSRMRELMLTTGELATDLGTVLDGSRAVKEGLADAVGTLADALRALREMCTDTQ